MRILLINDYATATGGAERQLLWIRQRLRELGHEVRLFAGRATAPGRPMLADHACAGTLSSFRTLLQTANPWAALALRRVLRAFRPDVVHVKLFLTQLSPLVLDPLRDVPTILHVVWYRPICPLGTKLLPNGRACRRPWGRACYANHCLPLRDWLPLELQRRLWRRRRRHVNLLVANSRAVADRLREAGLGEAAPLPNGVPVRETRPPLGEPPVVAFAGRLVPEKGVDVLLRAFAAVAGKVPGAQLRIAGDGPQRGALEVQAAGLGLAERTLFLGHLEHDALEQQLDSAWVQAVPSRWDEPFGLVAAEAMMRGTAVIATPGGGLGELVRDGVTGYHVPPNDARTLAARLVELLLDRERAEALGRAGRARAISKYNLDRHVERLLHYYEQVAHVR